MENSELEKQIDAWKEKVLSVHDGCGADTRKMMIDIDKIIPRHSIIYPVSLKIYNRKQKSPPGNDPRRASCCPNRTVIHFPRARLLPLPRPV